MKKKAINGRWVIWTTDSIADWDGLTGDPATDTGWESDRMRSMQRRLHYGDVLFEVGAEHGALSTVIAREFVGAENMVLIEPSPEFWPNIRRHWVYNGLNEPLACFPGFADAFSNTRLDDTGWPVWAVADAPEVGGMAYRSLTSTEGIKSMTLDNIADQLGYDPVAINMDIEGAEVRALHGAMNLLRRSKTLKYVWVSIHPDLIERDFGTTDREVHDIFHSCGWSGTHLGTDHEEHWLFQKGTN